MLRTNAEGYDPILDRRDGHFAAGMAAYGCRVRTTRGGPADPLGVMVAWGSRSERSAVDGQADSAEGALEALANAMRKSGQAFKVE
jgi:hypothetical protein